MYLYGTRGNSKTAMLSYNTDYMMKRCKKCMMTRPASQFSKRAGRLRTAKHLGLLGRTRKVAGNFKS